MQICILPTVVGQNVMGKSQRWTARCGGSCRRSIYFTLVLDSLLNLCCSVYRKVLVLTLRSIPTTDLHSFFGWFKRSLNQSIGSLSCNPHFALFQPDRRWDIFWNASDHWGMVTYNFFRNFFFRSLIRAHTGSFANVYGGRVSCINKNRSNFVLPKNRSYALVNARTFLFWGH